MEIVASWGLLRSALRHHLLIAYSRAPGVDPLAGPTFCDTLAVSFDLYIVNSEQPMSDAKVTEFVRRGLDAFEAGTSSDESADASRPFDSFISACSARWPGGSEDSPWASWPLAIEFPDLLSINLQWSTTEDVVRELLVLAAQHGLYVYDPQGDNVIPPNTSHSAATKSKVRRLRPFGRKDER